MAMAQHPGPPGLATKFATKISLWRVFTMSHDRDEANAEILGEHPGFQTKGGDPYHLWGLQYERLGFWIRPQVWDP